MSRGFGAANIEMVLAEENEPFIPDKRCAAPHLFEAIPVVDIKKEISSVLKILGHRLEHPAHISFREQMIHTVEYRSHQLEAGLAKTSDWASHIALDKPH